ncbi:MAG: type II secretion system protein GspK [Nibricoccus sp.]
MNAVQKKLSAVGGGARGASVLPALRFEGEKGSVLIIVLVTMIFAVAALTLFIEKASTDLLAEQRVITDARLRTEAYSALETTVGVLVDFRTVLGNLRSPAEGWGDPLGFAGYEPGEGREVQVSFDDESGKISLPNADAQTLTMVFKAWEMPQADAEKLADALLGWMKKEHTPSSVAAPTAEDYDRGDLPYQPPARSLRSFSEIAAINYARDMFYDEKGVPNDLWRRFVATFSLYNFRRPNLNSATPELIAALGADDPQQQQRLEEFRSGSGRYQASGAGVFKNANDIAGVLGAKSEAAGKVGTEISALRVIVTVREGLNSYRLAVLLAPSGGAKAPGAGSLNKKTAEQNNTSTQGGNSSAAAASGRNTATVKSLNYPFTLLEIRENGAIPGVDTTTSPPL